MDCRVNDWETMVAALQAFVQRHGHSCVPARSSTQPQLALWVAEQRTLRTKGALSDVQIRRLDRLSFVWQLEDPAWEAMFAAVATAVHTHGLEAVLSRTSSAAHQLPSTLSEWLGLQQRLASLGRMPRSAKARLDALGLLQTAVDAHLDRSTHMPNHTPNHTPNPAPRAPELSARSAEVCTRESMHAHSAGETARQRRHGAPIDAAFLQMNLQAQLYALHDALFGYGPLEKRAAVALVTEHLTETGMAQRASDDTTSVAQAEALTQAIEKALNASVRSGMVIRPRRGLVQAVWSDPTDYSEEDWRLCLSQALAVGVMSKERAFRLATQWAREVLGMHSGEAAYAGVVRAGLEAALAAAVSDGEVCASRGGQDGYCLMGAQPTAATVQEAPRTPPSVGVSAQSAPRSATDLHRAGPGRSSAAGRSEGMNPRPGMQDGGYAPTR